MAETLRVTAAIKVPAPPNFLRYEDPALKDSMVAIESLTDEQLDDLAELWKQGLMERVRVLREHQGGDGDE